MGSLSLRKEEPLEKPRGIMAIASAAISRLAETILKKVDLVRYSLCEYNFTVLIPF